MGDMVDFGGFQISPIFVGLKFDSIKCLKTMENQDSNTLDLNKNVSLNIFIQWLNIIK